jgi:Tfp pilus assembly protein PilN
MIQFNLLPDVKLEYIRTQRIKRLVIVSCIILIATSVVITSLLAYSVYGLQRQHITNLTNDIQESTREIQSIDQIDRVLTVQNQLNTITGLHDDKPVASRLFPFISTLTPQEVSITELDINYDESVLIITGESDTFETVNKFVDTLKFTNYVQTTETEAGLTEDVEGTSKRAFVGVELSDYSISTEGTAFVITANFEPSLFSSENSLRLVVPNTITTRSEQENPRALFIESTESEDDGNN